MRIRLIFSFFLIVIVAILSTVVIVRLNTPQQVQNYMLRGGMQGLDALVDELELFYRSNGDWDGVESLLTGVDSGMMGAGHGNGMMGGQRLILADSSRKILIDSSNLSVGQTLTREDLSNSIVLKNGWFTIGYLWVKGGMQATGGNQLPLVTRLNSAALQAGLIALVIALILAILLAEGILRPVRQLTRAAEKVAGGDWAHEVPVKGKDELTILAHSFNKMVNSLRQSEERRQRMTADIAHELRTPLAVQRAHLEALQDGIYPLTTENLQPILSQNSLLTRLVNDLRILALAESGELPIQKQSVNVQGFLAGLEERFRPAAQERRIRLLVESQEDCPDIQADPDRLTQIFTNLVGNALRYTPPGGEIRVASAYSGHQVIIQVSDNGSGIPAEDLPNIFERLYRGDKARAREDGGSGLGLAIARQLAEAHGAMLTAENKSEGGACFTFSIPIS